MKTDRFSPAFTRTTAIFLAGLLLTAGLPATGKSIRIGPVNLNISVDSPSKKLAQALIPQVKEVQNRFETKRRDLLPLKGSDGKPAYLRKDVSNLIAHTGQDLEEAIVKVQPSDLEPLRAWAAEEVARIEAELGTSPGPKTAAFPSDRFTPRAVAVVASLGSPPRSAPPKSAKPKAAKPKAAAPPPPLDTVPAEKSNSLLDEVGKVVGRIFFLAAKEDLEVKLWVGSTAPHAMFSFWSEGRIKGSTPAPTIIRTDGKKSGVLRGLYVYKATWTKGAVTQLIEYPKPAGTQVTPSERLDLVNGSGFFCCRFDESYCHDVANEKECRS